MAKQLFDISAKQAQFSYNRDLSPYDMPPMFLAMSRTQGS